MNTKVNGLMMNLKVMEFILLKTAKLKLASLKVAILLEVEKLA